MRRIIIADPDLNYAIKLQLKFFQKMQGAYEIDLITDKSLIKELPKYSMETDCLLINEVFMSDEVEKANFKKYFILVEDSPDSQSQISRYSDIDEIYNIVRNSIGINTRSLTKNQGTSVLLFKSASGGVGKTVLSLALAEFLANKHYKVLYVNTQTFQTFQYYLKDKSTIPNGEAMMLQHEKDVYYKLKSQIKNEGFNYLSPFTMPLYAYNINVDIYSSFIEKAKASKNYDYIIVDSDNNINLSTLKQITLADKIIFISRPGPSHVYANFEFFKKINLKEEKIIKICNYVEEGFLMEEVDEYISKWDNDIMQDSIHDFANSGDIYKLAVLIN